MLIHWQHEIHENDNHHSQTEWLFAIFVTLQNYHHKGKSLPDEVYVPFPI